MSVPETAQIRRAALLLHGLRPAMRAQVLARLDAAESALLKPLLDELINLGVSQTVGQRLLASEIQSHISPPRVLTLEEQLERLNPEAVVRCLDSCAPATVAQLMRAGNWSWKSAAFALMPEARRASVYESMRSVSPALAPAVFRVLCERLCACTSAQLDSPPAGGSSTRAGANPWAGWLAKIRTAFARPLGWIR